MSNLYIPVGLPGCGKSTLTEMIFPYAMRVSSDDIRNDLFGNAPYDYKQNELVFNTFDYRIQNYLSDYEDVIADATNLEKRAREKLYGLKGYDEVYLVVVLFTNMAQALERNKARLTEYVPGYSIVPDDVMQDKMIPRYEQTLREIDIEPWDSLIKIESVYV